MKSFPKTFFPLNGFFLLCLWIFITPAFADTNGNVSENLMEMDIEALMEVEVVTASKFSEKADETPSTMIVITDKDIAQRGYTDLIQLLSDQPGFDTIVINGTAYDKSYVRGHITELAERTQLYINGVNFQGLGFQDMKNNRGFPLSSIKRIEIVYGPSSAIYGPNAFSAIINIITKSPEDLKNNESNAAYTQVGAGAYNTAYTEATYVGKSHDVGVFISGRYYKSDEPDYSDQPGFFSNDIIRNSWRPMADRYNSYEDPTNDYTVLFKLNFKDLEFGYDRLYYAEGSGPEYALDKTLPSPQWKDFRNMAYLRYAKDASDSLHVSTLITHKEGDTPPDSAWAERYDYDADNPEDPGYGNPDVSMGYWQFYNEQYTFQQDFVCRLNSQVILNGGASLETTDYQKGYQVYFGDWVEDDETAYTNYPDTPPDNVGEDRRFKMRLYGGYVQLKWHDKKENFFIVPGVRHDHNSIYENTTNPRFGIVYKFTEDYILKANYGSGFQYPSPRNLYGSWEGTTVSENLKPETIDAYELGFLFPASQRIQNEVSLFYNQIKNASLKGENLPQRNIYGLEYKANASIDTVSDDIRKCNIFFNYSYIRPKYDEAVSSSATGRISDDVGEIAEHKFNLGASAEFFNLFNVTLRNNYVGERKTIVSNPIKKIKPYFISNLVLNIPYSLKTTKMGLSFAVNNLFNKRYFHPGNVDAGAGEDTSRESLAWYSSRLPQYGRHYMLTFDLRL